MPFPRETGIWAPGPGYGFRNTSSCPDELETYAIQRPSGENLGARSFAGVSRNGCGCSSLLRRSKTQILRLVGARNSKNVINFPSCDQEGAATSCGRLRSTAAVSPAFGWIDSIVVSGEWTRRLNVNRPSGVHAVIDGGGEM